MPRGRRYLFIPADLSIEMGVYIDETGGDELSASVDFSVSDSRNISYFDDKSIRNGYVASIGFFASSIYDEPVSNN
jgi:hypothetical protein